MTGNLIGIFLVISGAIIWLMIQTAYRDGLAKKNTKQDDPAERRLEDDRSN